MDMPKYATLQKVRNGERKFGVTPRIPGGFVTPEILIRIAEVSKKYNGILKITSGQRIAILGLQPEDVNKVWEELGMEPAVLSPYSVKNVEMCPAAFCKRAKQNSLKLGLKLEKEFYGAKTPNRTKIAVAGCRNACTSVYSKDIGVVADINGYLISVGGSGGFYPRLPNILITDITEDEAFLMVKIIINYYNEKAELGVKISDFIDKITFEKFQEDVLNIFNVEKTK